MVNIVSLNVKGLNSPQKRRLALNYFHKIRAHIAAVQETHFKAADPPQFTDSRYPHCYTANGPTKKAGVAILISQHCQFSLSSQHADPEGRFLILVGKLEEVEVTIASYYAPNSGQLAFCRKYHEVLSRHARGAVLTLGDFNMVLDPGIDKSKVSTARTAHLQDSAKQFRQLLAEFEMYDTWRAKHPSVRDFTFYSNVHRTYSRIDLALVDRWTLASIDRIDILPMLWSDHSPLFLSWKIGNRTVTPGPWRLGRTALSQQETRDNIQGAITSFLNTNKPEDTSTFNFWCSLKAVIRGSALQAAARQKRLQRDRYKQEVAEMTKLESAHKADPSNRCIYVALLSAREKVNAFSLREVRRNVERLNQQFYAFGNRASRLLARKLRGRRAKERVLQIYNSRGTKVTDPVAIANTFAAYYQQLYNLKDDLDTPQPTHAVINKFLDSISLPTIDRETALTLNLPWSLEEVEKAIDSLPADKAPGPDGYPSNFYRTFKSMLAPVLLEVFNSASDTHTFPKEMLEARIVAIPKPGKNPTSVQNYRPIALLNTDVKLYAKLISNRLGPILPKIINPDQVGFVSGRQAPDNTRRVIDVMEYCDVRKQPLLILSLDAEKAFDRLHWGYLRTVLLKYGFNGRILDSVLALYSSPSARVFINGCLSAGFDINNGTRQGCPLSPLIFALAIEPLAEGIRSRDTIIGPVIGGHRHVVSLFADDILLSLFNPEDSLRGLHAILEEYSAVSYYKLNTSKTEALPCNIPGDILKILRDSYKYAWQHRSIKYLGVQLANGYDIIDCNYGPLLKAFEELTKGWMLHEVSWLGRIAATKMALLPKLMYLFRTIPRLLPNALYIKFNRVLGRYIWKGSKPRIARNTLSLPKRKGGVAFPDLERYHSACLLNQAKDWFSTDSPKPWVIIERAAAFPLPIQDLLLLPMTETTPGRKFNGAIHTTLKVWHKLVTASGENWLPASALPLSTIAALIPNLQVDQWVANGLTNLGSLFINHVLAPFSQLQDHGKLPKGDFYKYLQLRHWITSHNASLYKESCFPQEVLAKLRSPTQKGGISRWYRYLTSTGNREKLSAQTKWEADLSRTLSEEEWDLIFRTCFTVSKCINHSEMFYKLIHRAYYTPAKLHSIWPSSSRCCWRGCGSVGDIFHIFWLCPLLKSLWISVFRLISSVIGIEVQGAPEIALLHLFSNLPLYSDRYVAGHILVATKASIAQLWKSDKIPNLQVIISKVHKHFLYETSDLRTSPTSSYINSKWSKWGAFSTEQSHLFQMASTVDMNVLHSPA